MITAGVDAGNKFVKVVLVEDGEIVSTGIEPSGFDQEKSALNAFNMALSSAELSLKDVKYVLATGAGRKEIDFADANVTEISAAARGVIKIFPSARIVIDVGAESGRAIKIDRSGGVTDFAVNEKCAAGTGSFMESMSRALEIPLEEMGALSLKAEKAVSMNAQCAVFAESEVISLIHSKISKADIARSIHEAVAGRVSSMVRRIGLEKDVVMIGGVARNKGFVAALENDLGAGVLVDEEKADYISALGAALLAAEKADK